MPLILLLLVLAGIYGWLGPQRRVELVFTIGVLAALFAAFGILMESFRWIIWPLAS